MKFVKANMYLIIMGGVVLVALLACGWYFTSGRGELEEKMKARMLRVSEVRGLSKVKIEIPGREPFVGAVAPNVIAVRAKIQKHTKQQVAAISEMAADNNGLNRVDSVGGRLVPVLYDPTAKKMTSLAAFVPRIDRSTDGHAFKELYELLSLSWQARLSGAPKVSAMPPTPTEIQTAFAAAQAEGISSAAKGLGGNILTPPPGVTNTKAIDDFTRMYVSNRAAALKMYVDPKAFVVADWAFKSDAPREPQIFEAVVQSWIQEDLIRAILQTNGTSTDVGKSAVKRLDKISIGGSGTTSEIGGGNLFAPRNATTTIDFSRSMTGRSGTSAYDVVMINLRMVIDPAKLNAFQEALYRQNNGYTVLNVKQSAVDPYIAASEGFLFGQTQCIHVDMQIECLMFRKWSVPVMPPEIQKILGITAEAPK